MNSRARISYCSSVPKCLTARWSSQLFDQDLQKDEYFGLVTPSNLH